MTPKLILHIPHSSTHIPSTKGYVVNKESLEKEIDKLTDWYTDDLFYSVDDEMVIAGFSRIFCDVERFADDNEEVMAQYGMGVLYEKNDDDVLIRTITPELRESVLNDYYWRHHSLLSKKVNEQLHQHGKVLIIDCHSFPNSPLNRDLDKTPNRPDFNIGTDPYHTSKQLLDCAIEYFGQTGYSVGINWPYKGTIVPLEHYNKHKDVQSIMLEINRSLYLNDQSIEKSENYEAIKEIICGFMRAMKNQFQEICH